MPNKLANHLQISVLPFYLYRVQGCNSVWH